MAQDDSPNVTWRDLLDKSLEVGLGAIVLTKQSVSRLIDELVAKGSLGREEAKRLVSQMLERGREGKAQVESLIAQAVERVVERADLVRRSDLDALATRVARLEGQTGPGEGAGR
jgi:polyhydroxyalkanoate synthesis regulator phasin